MERTKKGLIKSIHCNIPSQHRRTVVQACEGSCTTWTDEIFEVSRCVRCVLGYSCLRPQGLGWLRVGELGCKGKRFDCPTSKAAEDRLEVRRARRGGKHEKGLLYADLIRVVKHCQNNAALSYVPSIHLHTSAHTVLSAAASHSIEARHRFKLSYDFDSNVSLKIFTITSTSPNGTERYALFLSASQATSSCLWRDLATEISPTHVQISGLEK